MLKRVAALGTVFKEVAVAEMIVAHVALGNGVVGAVNRETAIVGLPDRRVADVLPGYIVCHVPVHRISRQVACLSHPQERHTLDMGGATGEHDRVAAEAGGRFRRVALYGDVAGQKCYFGPFVNLAPGDRLHHAPVRIAQRGLQRHGRRGRAGDHRFLCLAGVEVGGSDHDAIAGPPRHRLREQERRAPGRCGGGDASPPQPRFSVQLERSAAKNRQDLVADG